MDITVGVRMDTVISLRRRVETGEVIDDEHAGRRGGLGRGELRDARVQISNARIGRGAVRREDLGEEQRCLRLRLAHGVDELAELVERAIETLALENVVRTEGERARRPADTLRPSGGYRRESRRRASPNVLRDRGRNRRLAVDHGG